MDFLLDIASFLLQALILLAVFLVAVAGVVAISQRKRGAGDDGFIEARLLNDRYEAHQESLRAVTEDEADAKAREKAKKKAKKIEEKARKRALKTADGDEVDHRPRVFVVDFDGDMQASAVTQLREEVSAILPVASEKDEVLVRLESGGGVVHGYGLAASQRCR
jgi:serine protease SohB